MTDKDSNGYLTWILGGIAAGAMGLYTAGIGTGYAIWGRELDEIKEAQQAAVCSKELEPVWKEFQERCATKTIDTLYDGSSDPVVKQRKEIVERLDCPSLIKENRWKCTYDLSEKKVVAKKE